MHRAAGRPYNPPKGEGREECDEWLIDPANFEVQDLCKLLLGSVVLRPIAWTFT